MLHEAVDTALRESIVGYLRAKAESAVSVIELIERTAAADDTIDFLPAVSESLLAMNVARSGYLYVVGGGGEVVVHPDVATRGRVIPDVEPVRTQLQTREGYLEYIWQNSFEPLPLPKALYMEFYEPRSWIVAATAYRQEFVDLVDRHRLSALVSAYTVESSSYSVVVNRKGQFVVHPDFPGHDLVDFFDSSEAARIMAFLFAETEGQIYYSWPDRVSGEGQPKLLVFRYLPDFDWAIATTIDLRTIRRPIVFLAAGAVVFAAVLVFVVIMLSLRLARTVSDPIVSLAGAATAGTRVAVSNTSPDAPRELAILLERFNSFIERIEDQQTSLQNSVHEKTVLVREIHHRVKNNLQVIASLLNLQAGEVVDAADAALFDRSRDRVISMALVHEQLYQQDDLSSIPFDLYLGDLVRHLSHSSLLDGVRVTVRAEDAFLSIERAVPCGLIVNELVSNACEHAFKGMSTGEIEVVFRSEGQQFLLTVSDNGNGLGGSADESLGLTLVRMLVEQIDGSLEVVVENGTAFIVRFPS